MKITKKLGICILLLVSIILIQNVYALGLSPARKIIDFNPSFQDNVELKVMNTDAKDMRVLIYVEGEFSENIELNTTELIFSSDEEIKRFSYNFKLPENLDLPGVHETKIVVREIPLEAESDGTIIGGSVAVAHQFRVNVHYPGKYAVADLKVVETGRIDRVDFIVSVTNLGRETIEIAKGIIDIYDKFDQKLTTVGTNLDSIGPESSIDLKSSWEDEDVKAGKYLGKLTLTYDGMVAYDDREFYVGQLMVDIIDIVVEGFRLGGIAKFVILVDNKWPESIDDVHVEFIFSKINEEISKVKSATETIDALFKGELTAYWDTEGVEEGIYDTKINLHYENQNIEKDMKTYVGLNSIEFSLFGGAVVAKSGGVDKMDAMIIAIVLLVIINIGWFVYFKRRKNKK
jgi:hypothetical protein